MLCINGFSYIILNGLCLCIKVYLCMHALKGLSNHSSVYKHWRTINLKLCTSSIIVIIKTEIFLLTCRKWTMMYKKLFCYLSDLTRILWPERKWRLDENCLTESAFKASLSLNMPHSSVSFTSKESMRNLIRQWTIFNFM